MCKNIGNAISQYAIIIGLVILALIPVFLIFGNTINKSFTDFLHILQNKDVTTTSSTNLNTVINSTSKNTSNYSGTPTSNCEDGSCTIDYGDFVLTGIPDDFSGFIETHGTSGGTETLVALLDQMAEQMKDNVPPEDYQTYKELANLGHILADFEASLEDTAKNCANYKVFPDECMQDKIGWGTKYTLNSPLLKQFSNLSNELNYSGYTFNVGYAMNQYINDPETFGYEKDNQLAFAIVDKYKLIMNSDNVSEKQKAVTQELYWQIGNLSTKLGKACYDSISDFEGEVNTSGSLYADPITGEFSDNDKTITHDVTAIYDVDTSKITDIDSALICVTGKHLDSGQQCH